MEANVLFEVLKEALWGDELRTKTKELRTKTKCFATKTKGAANFQFSIFNSQLIKLAEQQTVTPLVLQVLERKQVELPKEERRRMLIYTQKSVKHNRKLNQEIGALVTLFQQHGIDYVVVKGQVLAVCYAHPVLRQGGDIDFYCDGQTFGKAWQLLKAKWGVKVHDEKVETYEFYRDDVLLEMHQRLLHFYNQRKDAYWEKLLRETPRVTVAIEGYEVKTLHPTVHSLYVFLHLWHHLVELGVGLRQFCDLAMMLHHHRQDINHEEVRTHLQELGLEKAYRACGCILVEQLGLPAEDFPYQLTAQDRKYTQRILDVVFYRGNMGLYNRKGGVRGWKHVVEATFVKLSHFMKFYPMAPGYMRGWMWNRVTQISRISQNS